MTEFTSKTLFSTRRLKFISTSEGIIFALKWNFIVRSRLIYFFLLILWKDQIELDFQQQKAVKKMHVTSNPFFKFHDDVFPNFAKNAVGDIRKFPQSAKALNWL